MSSIADCPKSLVHDVPVRWPDGSVSYLDCNTLVHISYLGESQPKAELWKLTRIDGQRVAVSIEGPWGEVEGWQREAMRLRNEVHALKNQVAWLEDQ